MSLWHSEVLTERLHTNIVPSGVSFFFCDPWPVFGCPSRANFPAALRRTQTLPQEGRETALL